MVTFVITIQSEGINRERLRVRVVQLTVEITK